MNEFENRMKKLVNNSLLEGNFLMLSSKISQGEIYKIPIISSLETLGFEYAFLYLKKGSGIIKHEHINDIEQYCSIDGDKFNNGICLMEDYHCIDRVKFDTIVETIKVSKYLINNYQNYSLEELNRYLVIILKEKEAMIHSLLKNDYDLESKKTSNNKILSKKKS